MKGSMLKRSLGSLVSIRDCSSFLNWWGNSTLRRSLSSQPGCLDGKCCCDKSVASLELKTGNSFSSCLICDKGLVVSYLLLPACPWKGWATRFSANLDDGNHIN